MKNTAISSNQLLQDIKRKFPPIFARHHLGQLTGMAINPKTIANLQSDPSVSSPPSFKVGRTVTFEKESFFEWLEGSGRVELSCNQCWRK
ncbi:MAG: hypothetical protein OCC45_08555 [Desulfotalea sp.]